MECDQSEEKMPANEMLCPFYVCQIKGWIPELWTLKECLQNVSNTSLLVQCCQCHLGNQMEIFVRFLLQYENWPVGGIYTAWSTVFFGIVPPDFISLNPQLNYVFTLFSFYILYISIVNSSIDSEYLFLSHFAKRGNVLFVYFYWWQVIIWSSVEY